MTVVGSKTPKCPGCGTKFSHDRMTLRCKACGLPDEVVAQGPKAIARWKRKPDSIMMTASGLFVIELTGVSKRERKLARLTPHQRGKLVQGHQTKHGRVGVKR